MSDLLYERDEHVVTLTLNRPHERNALGHPGDGHLFAEACARINADRSVRCVILTGAGSAFCAGGNLEAMRARSGIFSGPAADLRESYRTVIHRIVRALWTLEVPLVAAVNGPAVGLGNDLTTTADIRLASERARFGAPFVNLGLVPGDGGAWLLPRAIGGSRAAELLYTGALIDAATACAWGLVSRVVAHEQLMPEARALAAVIAAKPPIPVRMTKQMLRRADAADLDTVLELSANMQAIAQHTEDHEAALAAALDKREGRYQGR